MNDYRYHVFFCDNRRPDGEPCCAAGGAAEAHAYARQRVEELALKGPGRVRINQTGCLGRCAEGPLLVIYPQGIWYRYANCQDIEEIVVEHLRNDGIVNRLRLENT